MGRRKKWISGAEIRRIRESMHLSQADVAVQLGCSQSKISTLEQRDRVDGLDAHVWLCATCRRHFFRDWAMRDPQ